MITLRLARETDAAAILAIYGPYIKDTAITFENEVPSLQAFTERIRGIAENYPWLVCQAEGSVIGYGYAHRHMERAAYQWNAELSIYIMKGWLRCGLGGVIHSALTSILRLQNIRTVYGGVTLPNPNSEGLIASLGFQRVGVYHSAGFKCGAWHDVAWFEKFIGEHTDDPAPFLPFRELSPEAVGEILERHNNTGDGSL